ncbi:MAG: hypothetical protein VX228_16800, partial [Pseudomonadota bacterium]|nr:hypothetical protein [Pseudomonadota bacterium]
GSGCLVDGGLAPLVTEESGRLSHASFEPSAAEEKEEENEEEREEEGVDEWWARSSHTPAIGAAPPPGPTRRARTVDTRESPYGMVASAAR